MRMKLRKQNRFDSSDKVTAGLLQGGVYNINPGFSGSQQLNPKEPKYTDIANGAKVIGMMVLFLWWLPLLGPVVAGYLGGRRAGTPFRGFAAGAIVVAVIYGIIYSLTVGFFEFQSSVSVLPGMVVAATGKVIPELAPYATGFFDGFGSLFSGNFGTYGILVTFGVLGGMVSQQTYNDFRRAMRNTFGGFSDVFQPDYFMQLADMVAQRTVYALSYMNQVSKGMPMSLPEAQGVDGSFGILPEAGRANQANSGGVRSGRANSSRANSHGASSGRGGSMAQGHRGWNPGPNDAFDTSAVVDVSEEAIINGWKESKRQMNGEPRKRSRGSRNSKPKRVAKEAQTPFEEAGIPIIGDFKGGKKMDKEAQARIAQVEAGDYEGYETVPAPTHPEELGFATL